jgi:anticodon-binding protein
MEAESISERVSPFHATDVESILRAHGWLTAPNTPELESWMRDAADWLGMQAASHSESLDEQRERFCSLLTLVFSYNAAKLLDLRENQATMAREGVRETVRALANRVLQGGEIDSARLREIVDGLKQQFGSQGRRIFHPLRLALAGSTGEGELDRVILLLDRAAKLPFAVPVKRTRERMLEFCAAMQ